MEKFFKWGAGSWKHLCDGLYSLCSLESIMLRVRMSGKGLKRMRWMIGVAVEIIVNQTGHIQLGLVNHTGTQMAFDIKSLSGANFPISVLSSGYAEITGVAVAGGWVDGWFPWVFRPKLIGGERYEGVEGAGKTGFTLGSSFERT